MTHFPNFITVIALSSVYLDRYSAIVASKTFEIKEK